MCPNMTLNIFVKGKVEFLVCEWQSGNGTFIQKILHQFQCTITKGIKIKQNYSIKVSLIILKYISRSNLKMPFSTKKIL
jgi:hypothetical protein